MTCTRVSRVLGLSVAFVILAFFGAGQVLATTRLDLTAGAATFGYSTTVYNDNVLYQDFVASSSLLTDLTLVLKGVSATKPSSATIRLFSGAIPAYPCSVSDRWAGACSNTKLYEEVILTSALPSQNAIATTTIHFDPVQVLSVGARYHVGLYVGSQSLGWRYGEVSGSPYPGGAWYSDNGIALTSYPDRDHSLILDGIDNAVAPDHTPWTNPRTLISFPERWECLIASGTCPIPVDYQADQVGNLLTLVLQTGAGVNVETLTLPDQPVRRVYVHPTVRAATTTDVYGYYLLGADLPNGWRYYSKTVVYWVATRTPENLSVPDRIWLTLKQGFPFSIYYDVQDVLDGYLLVSASSSADILNLNQFLILPGFTASGTILSVPLVRAPLEPLYSNKIYPFLEYLGHGLALGYLIFLLYRIGHRAPPV